MQIITYFSASIVSYLGLLLGIVLISIAPEEQRPGIRYFIFFKQLLLLLILSFLLLFYEINLILALIILFLFAVSLFNKKIDLIKKLEKYYLVYFIFGIAFFISSKIIDFFVIESILIFLYGIPSASVIFNLKKKNYKDVFLKNALFFAPIILLYLIF